MTTPPVELREWLLDWAGLHPRAVDKTLDKLEDQDVFDVQGLGKFATLPQFDTCLTALTAHEIRAALARANFEVSSFQTPVRAVLSSTSPPPPVSHEAHRDEADEHTPPPPPKPNKQPAARSARVRRLDFSSAAAAEPSATADPAEQPAELQVSLSPADLATGQEGGARPLSHGCSGTTQQSSHPLSAPTPAADWVIPPDWFWSLTVPHTPKPTTDADIYPAQAALDAVLGRASANVPPRCVRWTVLPGDYCAVAPTGSRPAAYPRPTPAQHKAKECLASEAGYIPPEHDWRRCCGKLCFPLPPVCCLVHLHPNSVAARQNAAVIIQRVWCNYSAGCSVSSELGRRGRAHIRASAIDMLSDVADGERHPRHALAMTGPELYTELLELSIRPPGDEYGRRDLSPCHELHCFYRKHCGWNMPALRKSLDYVRTQALGELVSPHTTRAEYLSACSRIPKLYVRSAEMDARLAAAAQTRRAESLTLESEDLHEEHHRLFLAALAAGEDTHLVPSPAHLAAKRMVAQGLPPTKAQLRGATIDPKLAAIFGLPPPTGERTAPLATGAPSRSSDSMCSGAYDHAPSLRRPGLSTDALSYSVRSARTASTPSTPPSSTPSTTRTTTRRGHAGKMAKQDKLNTAKQSKFTSEERRRSDAMDEDDLYTRYNDSQLQAIHGMEAADGAEFDLAISATAGEGGPAGF